MEVGMVSNSYYAAVKSYMQKEEKQTEFAEKVAEKSPVSPEEMTLEEYKAYFHEKMNSLYVHPSQKNRNEVIDITDAAYKRMQTDPEYEKKILDAFAKNWAVDFGGYIPVFTYTHVDDTWGKCYGYTKGMRENVGYSGSSSANGNDAVREKRARQKKQQEEYLEKRAQMKEFQQETWEKKIAKQELSEAEEMELFKKEFYQELSQITTHATVSNAAVNVTEAAFKRMKDDPEYKQQVLNWIKHDLGASYGSRNASVMLTVGETLEQCRGDAWPISADSEFGIRSQDSFYKSSNERKERQKELMEKYLQKRQTAKQIQQEMLDEKAAKAEQERSRLTRAWSNKRQLAAAFDAYDANIMMETAAGGDSLLS